MKIEIGRKYRTKSGCNVEILKTGVRSRFGFSVVALCEGESGYSVEFYTEDGRYRREIVSTHDLVEVSPYEDFKIDDPVVVWDEGSYKVKGHFAGIDGEGKPMTFVAGQRSSRTKGTSVWDHCIKADDYRGEP